MSIRIKRSGLAMAAAWLLMAAPAAAQDTSLARAKDYYASASYEEALQVLDQLRARTATPSDAIEVSAYQVYCLMALGRSDEAKHAVETIVHVDPLYHPSVAQASPRVRAFFEDVRRPLLPDVVREMYNRAKDSFDRKDMPAATAGFDRVITLVDEMGPNPAQGLGDLRTLASGFRDLSKAATPPPPPPPAPKPVEPPAEVKAAPPPPPKIYSSDDADVTAPVPVSRVMPPWTPVDAFEAKQEYRGVLDLVIGEDGRVVSVTLTKAVQPRYDPLLVRAAKDWRFQPALRNGVAVKYQYRMQIHIGH